MMPIQQSHSAKHGFPLRFFAAAFVASILAIVFSGWHLWHEHNHSEEILNKHIALERGIGRIMLFDEVLTMSARMAAGTGDFSYEKRYDQFDPALIREIHAVRTLLPKQEIEQFVGETDEANLALVKMERQAFALAHQGSLREAAALLSSDEYMLLKKKYAAGMEKTVRAAKSMLEENIRYGHFLFIEAVAVSAVAVLLLFAAWFFAVRSTRNWDQERMESEDALLQAHEGLEAQVEQRTADLLTANEKLQQEISIRKVAEEKFKKSIQKIHLSQAATLNMMEDAEESRKEAEQAKASLVKQRNLLSSLNEAFIQLGPDYNLNVQRLTQACGQFLGAACALYSRMEGGMLCAIGQWHTPGGFKPVDKPEGHICYDIIRKDKKNGAFVIRNLPETGYYKTDPNVAAYGLKTYIGHAVGCGEQTVGSLCAVFQEDMELGENEGMIMEMLAKALESEEERRLAQEELKQFNSDLKATQNASLNIMADLDRERKALDKSLQEKEALIREVHHRVKNNMQIISSLLKLQSNHIDDPSLKEIFKDSENRISSMAKVHERLYRTEDLAHIDFGDYINSLAIDIYHSFGAKASNIGLRVNVEDVALPIDTAIPCGLIVNELITNAIKYAFPGERKGELVIEMRKTDKLTIDNGQSSIELVVRDNGVGIPEDMDWKTAKSLGLNLVASLTKQIRGVIELNREGGTEWRIRFGEGE